ncbi:hypothetical protein BDF20DRAFT_825577 [Mycotypha africana]|uniref:uncharacterized protein n=1 Tax=Mycotypha africana TaxID=64632 RepID=UPI002301D3C5|nr:uncharacterized protein BDF20DRAFT_825577 [Mycotypha africana]KAI8971739.1 hypothetical protein BDF20DRAFT_825577 [Mycotypha africana]
METVSTFPQGFFFIRCKSQPLAIDVSNGSMTVRSFYIIGIERDKPIIQYARKPGLAHNQRWIYKEGFISPTTAPHLVLDIRNSEFKNGNTVFLNSKSVHSKTQQWIIQPFENEKSAAELALLRPSPLQRNSTFPRQDELYDCYRMVYLESAQSVTTEQLAGAAAFKVRAVGMKDYIQAYKQSHNNEPIVANEQTRQELINYVRNEVIRSLDAKQIEFHATDIIDSAANVAESYFSREYSTY